MKILHSLLYILLLPTTALALTKDKTEPVFFEADSAILDQKNGTGKFYNHVKLHQGHSHIVATKGMTYLNNKGELIKAVAIGNINKQAHYWTLLKNDKPEFHAFADKIEFYPQKDKIILIGHAHIQQGPDTFKAPKIVYDIKKDRIETTQKSREKTVISLTPK